MNSKNKILLGILVVLVLLTGFVIFNTIQQYAVSKKYKHEKRERCPKPLPEHFLQEKLHFDAAQMQTYEHAHREFQLKADRVMERLEALKHESFIELKKETVDIQRLDSLADAIGTQHAVMKSAINTFYLELKTVCKPDQIDDLENAFQPLFNRKHRQKNKPFRHSKVNSCQ